MTIKKCSLCQEINYLFYEDYAKGTSINLCFDCAKLTGFNPKITKEIICARCRKPFEPFKNENVCWICKKNFSKKINKEVKPICQMNL